MRQLIIITGIKFTISCVLLVGSYIIMASDLRDGVLGIFAVPLFLLCIPVSILTCIDFGQSIRTSRPKGIVRYIGILLGVPQALFGFMASAVGVVLPGFVTYDYFVNNKLPVGPWWEASIAFFCFGMFLMRTAFVANSEGATDQSINPPQ